MLRTKQLKAALMASLNDHLVAGIQQEPRELAMTTAHVENSQPGCRAAYRNVLEEVAYTTCLALEHPLACGTRKTLSIGRTCRMHVGRGGMVGTRSYQMYR